MRRRVAASSAAVVALLATSILASRLLNISGNVEQVATSSNAPWSAPNARDYESRLDPSDLSSDSNLVPSQSSAPTRLTLAVGDGDTLASLLATANVPVSDAQSAVDAARRVYDPRRLRVGQFVTVSFASGDIASGGGTFQGLELQADSDHLIAVERGVEGSDPRLYPHA